MEFFFFFLGGGLRKLGTQGQAGVLIRRLSLICRFDFIRDPFCLKIPQDSVTDKLKTSDAVRHTGFKSKLTAVVVFVLNPNAASCGLYFPCMQPRC